MNKYRAEVGTALSTSACGLSQASDASPIWLAKNTTGCGPCAFYAAQGRAQREAAMGYAHLPVSGSEDG
jgi:hypothetical protein